MESQDPLFCSRPILNSPYEEPDRHWELDEKNQPTGKILEFRRLADFITPIPRPKSRRGEPVQAELVTDRTLDKLNRRLSARKKRGACGEESADQKFIDDQEYCKSLINKIRGHVKEWRKNPVGATPTAKRLLNYWRSHKFSSVRPFFCQLEAVETAIWLAERAQA